MEAVVNVTGARPSGSGGSRDLFSEEAVTVLVFKDGAVVRLTSPVSVGQLLFLTNNKSKEEVVCQVLHKRSFQAAAWYVELQFTEERPNFWGVAFPEGKRGGNELKLAEQPPDEATLGGDPAAVRRKGEDANRLQNEVERLREQLFALDNKKAAEPAKTREPQELKASNTKPDLLPVKDMNQEIAKGMSDVLAPLMPESADKKESDRPVVGMALPTRKSETADPGDEGNGGKQELFPEPALHTSRMAAWVEPLRERDSKETDKPKSEGRGKARSIGLIMALLLALAGGALYGKWWQYLPGRQKPLAAEETRMGRPNGAPGAQATKGKSATATTREPVVKWNGATGAASAIGDSGAKPGTRVGPAEEALGRKGEERAAEPRNVESATGEEIRRPVAEKKRVAGSLEPKKNGASSATGESGDGEVAASDAPLIAAKLIKAVNPVYPPDAMRKYITGDVKAEVVVEPSGRVGEVKVLAGPQALRAAAVEALKRYEFAPATQGGKAVASTATEVVKFWFNP